ncbi:MAG TPA: hypothetical protein VH682_14070 [Gemmataceae bacterium]|jgi:hypothetical protein
MIQQMWTTPQATSHRILTPCQWKALRLLNEAWAAACSEGVDVWQFAVEIDQLRALGLSHTDMRCLLQWGYLEHAGEKTKADSSQRIFHHLNTLFLPRRSCFVLTGKGWEIASEIGNKRGVEDSVVAREPTAVHCSLSEVPQWNNAARQLWWRDFLIKEFHVPAPNQELVLAALEEEGWPARMDDPLPRALGINSKVRLHDTIKSLNRHHLHRVLRFGGDGSGLGVRWLLVKKD